MERALRIKGNIVKQALQKLILYAGLLTTSTLCSSALGNAVNAPMDNWNTLDMKHIDDTIIDFMTKYGISGSSIAIVKDGCLVFAKGYGFANKSTGEAVDTTSLFRIASISKSITSVAIMRLVEDGELNLNDHVFGEEGILGKQYGTMPYSKHEKAITIEYLLTHTAGGKAWSNSSPVSGKSDPMFSHKEMNHNELIGWILDTRDPSELPGTTYSYSNFGYCVLGRVIEVIAKQSYESYVKNYILKPMGITSMKIGGNKRADRYPDEVEYDGFYIPFFYDAPYEMEVRRMDAHGGWLATATDLTRFMVYTDGFSTKPDFLKNVSIETMTTPSTANRYYAKGWSVNTHNNWWHGGSLPGTSSILVRTSNGFCWAFLANKRKKGEFSLELDQMMWKAVNGVSSWPNIDLF